MDQMAHKKLQRIEQNKKTIQDSEDHLKMIDQVI